MKRSHNQGQFPNTYFWRRHQKQEIDYPSPPLTSILEKTGTVDRQNRDRKPKKKDARN
jgi:hypothetical protein